MHRTLLATVVCKTSAEFECVGFHGTPYAVIVRNEQSKKSRMYELDTQEKSYYPVAEWSDGDRESWNHWYEKLLAVDREIVSKREKMRSDGMNWGTLDKVERVISQDRRLIRDLAHDDWSHRP